MKHFAAEVPLLAFVHRSDHTGFTEQVFDARKLETSDHWNWDANVTVEEQASKVTSLTPAAAALAPPVAWVAEYICKRPSCASTPNSAAARTRLVSAKSQADKGEPAWTGAADTGRKCGRCQKVDKFEWVKTRQRLPADQVLA
ncbi:MAG: hypothetical protein MUF00_17500 [Gemmatimonadaceae bacterium]|nr:hypothetical protein [Gemmatimonadaceae bacterium]